MSRVFGRSLPPVSTTIRRLDLVAHLGRDARLLFLGMMIWDFGVGIYAAFWPIYIESLGASPFIVGLLIGGQAVIRIALSLPSGIVADRASRRRLILFTTLIGIPGSIIYGISQSWWHLIPGLLLMAITNFSIPALSSYISDSVSARDRARAFSLIYTVGPSIAFIISPIVGGMLAEATSLRVLFFVSAGAYALATVAFAGISERPHKAHEGPAASYREAMALPTVRTIAVLAFLVLGTMAIGITLLPNYLEEVRGLSIGTIGRLGAIAPIGAILMTTIISRTAAITAPRGIALATLAIGSVCAAVLLTGNVWLLSVAYLARGGFMVAWSLLTATVGEHAPERLRGRSFAFVDFLGGAGFGLAPLLSGALYGLRPGLPMLVTAIATPVLIAIILLVERRRLRHHPGTDPAAPLPDPV